ncbi:MAG: hypothetical protein RLY66_86 [Candidatus Parcubacteria bacterium]|jgi:chromosome segregation ATPase
MNNPKNVTEMVQQLQNQIKEEIHELTSIQEELRAHEAKAAQLKQEIPQLQKKVEIDRHELYATESDIPKLKAKIAEIQRAKLKAQSDLTNAQHSFQEGLRKSGTKLR